MVADKFEQIHKKTEDSSTKLSTVETYMNQMQYQDTIPNIMSLNIIEFVYCIEQRTGTQEKWGDC